MSGMVCEHTAETYANRTEIKLESKGYEGVRRTTKEHEGIQRDTKECEGIERNTGEYKGIQGIQRNTREYTVPGCTREYKGRQVNTKQIPGNTTEHESILRRNTKEYMGIQRNTEESYIEHGWGGFVWLVGSLHLEGLW